MKSFAFILFLLLSADGRLFAIEGCTKSAEEEHVRSLVTARQPEGSSAANREAIQPWARRVLTVEEFARDKYQRPAQEIAVSVQIHPSLSNYVFHLIPARVDNPDRGLQPVGRIEILKGPSGPVFQTINVSAEASTDSFIRRVEFMDINHDGYLDLMSLAEFGGAKWGRYQHWIFEPKSGRFITNWLTKRVSRFQCNDIRPDARTGEIHVNYLVLNGVMDEGYQIHGQRLMLVSKQEIRPKTNGGFVITTKRLINQKMRVVKVEQVPTYP